MMRKSVEMPTEYDKMKTGKNNRKAKQWKTKDKPPTWKLVRPTTPRNDINKFGTFSLWWYEIYSLLIKLYLIGRSSVPFIAYGEELLVCVIILVPSIILTGRSILCDN